MKGRGNMLYLDYGAVWRGILPETERAVKEYLAGGFGNPGRSGHELSLRGGEAVYKVRERAAELFGSEAERVVFTLNTTYALNIAVKGMARLLYERKGRRIRIMTSALEHNSVMRPLYDLEDEGIAEIKVFLHALNEGGIDREESLVRFQEELTEDIDLAVMMLRSNLTGERVLTGEMGRLCRERNIPLIADGAQSAGHERIDIREEGIDILCIPGHKGLMGCMSLGIMIFNESLNDIPIPIITGGSGTSASERGMPRLLPERLEGGTLPLLPILTAGGGMQALMRMGYESIESRERLVTEYTLTGLKEMKGIRVYSPETSRSMVLFTSEKTESGEICRSLSEEGICVRGGIHCSPCGHRFLSTGGNAVRVSFSWQNSLKDCEYFLRKLSKLLT